MQFGCWACAAIKMLRPSSFYALASTDMSPMRQRTPEQAAESALIAVYRRLLLHAVLTLLPTPSSPRVRRMGSRRPAEGCVDANTQCARLQASGKTLGSQKKAPGPQRCSSQPVLLFVADCLKLAISHPQRCGRVTAITAPSQGPQGHLRGTPPPPRRARNDALPVLRPLTKRRHDHLQGLSRR